MNYIYLILLFALFQESLTINSSRNFKSFERLGFRIIICKRNMLPKLQNYIAKFKQTYDNLYEKFIIIYSESIIKYENLNDEDKQIIEFIISNVL
jgi:hypothetical protein